MLNPRWSDGCLYDCEGMGYEDNEGGDYPINLEDEMEWVRK